MLVPVRNARRLHRNAGFADVAERLFEDDEMHILPAHLERMLDHIGQGFDQHQDDRRRPSLRHEQCDGVGRLGRRFLAGFAEVLRWQLLRAARRCRAVRPRERVPYCLSGLLWARASALFNGRKPRLRGYRATSSPLRHRQLGDGLFRRRSAAHGQSLGLGVAHGAQTRARSVCPRGQFETSRLLPRAWDTRWTR
jgi:hypothetical protein